MLGFTALAVVIEPGLAGLLNKGPHGFSEVLYAYTSARPTMAAPSPASPPTRCSTTRRLGIAMLLGRFGMIVPMLAVAGSLAAKKRTAALARHPADQPARCSWACWSASS